MAVLEVNNLKKYFGKSKILKGISFSLEEGETVAIIGSSGSGKTTLLRCLNFLERPTSGQILVNGKVIFNADEQHQPTEQEIRAARSNFGMVFQQFNLFPQYTAKENIMLAPTLAVQKDAGRKEALAEIGKNAERLLAEVGLADRADRYPHQLSGGQQQRVAIARALALSPRILCFDEPTSALDPELTGEVLKVIRGLADRQKTMIIVTHEMAFARDVADRVIFLDAGVIAEEGNAFEVIEHPQSERLQQFLSRYENA